MLAGLSSPTFPMLYLTQALFLWSGVSLEDRKKDNVCENFLHVTSMEQVLREPPAVQIEGGGGHSDSQRHAAGPQSPRSQRATALVGLFWICVRALSRFSPA